jgi:hypothetical protein
MTAETLHELTDESLASVVALFRKWLAQAEAEQLVRKLK